ncbi:hypothetical protein P5G50_13705 [Leifsonia sp. F6_8S_P_1B]|uniref:Uncharacterized protein n=1 Tax=Leifsonia williamsii TaxID=3035919 RepID=A0ABT8KDH4_9MICO|nr:hypothetical protein [Leifsonia williamsii]MDN4615505.1 hypothetical protein [Leifsonia williamsii]
MAEDAQAEQQDAAETLMQPPPTTQLAAAPLPAAPLLRRARTLLLWALGAAVVYSTLSGSKGSCPGGFSADGYVDAAGDPTDVAPQCFQATLHPSPVVYLAIAVTVIVAVTRAARATDLDRALRTLNRATILVVAIAVVSMVIATVWIFVSPAPTDGTVFFPFPFGSGTMTITPMEPPTGG